MYTEFIVIYVLLGVAILLLAAVLVFAIRILKKLDQGGVRTPMQNSYRGASYNQGTPVVTGNQVSLGTVFCKKCGAQFDGIHKICPKCGTPRV